MKKKIPTFKSDRETERFVAEADLSRYDLSGAKLVRLVVPNARSRSVRRRVAASVAKLDPRSEDEALQWIEAVSAAKDDETR